VSSGTPVLQKEPEAVSRAQRAFGALGAASIRLWLRVFGRPVRRDTVPWLEGPSGPPGGIGAGLYDVVAVQQGLTLDRSRNQGLLPSFDVLKGPAFDPVLVHPAIRAFYERTSSYELDVWSETVFPARLFLWLLVHTVSRSMDQLNFPVSSLEVSRGITSDVLPLVEPETGRVRYTGWLRRLTASGRVIYAGFYSVTQPPLHDGPCVKVVFPIPHGNATVIFRPEVDRDGSFRLISSGAGFGGPGFYRSLEAGEGQLRVRYLRTLREFFHVFVDDAGTLRTDHRVEFLGFTVLKLHYRLTPSPVLR